MRAIDSKKDGGARVSVALGKTHRVVEESYRALINASHSKWGPSFES